MFFIFCFVFVVQLSWGKLRREPATRWFDESFAPINKFEDRFARQNPFELPPEFPLASPYSFIDHHLSGLSIYTFTLYFQHLVFYMVLFGFFTYENFNNYLLSLHIKNFLTFLIFVYLLNSLARVSRRVINKHFINIHCYFFLFISIFLFKNFILFFFIFTFSNKIKKDELQIINKDK